MKLLTLPIAFLGKYRPGWNHVFPLLFANCWTYDIDSHQVQKSESYGYHWLIRYAHNWLVGSFPNKIFHIDKVIYGSWITEFICLSWDTIKVEKRDYQIKCSKHLFSLHYHYEIFKKYYQIDRLWTWVFIFIYFSTDLVLSQTCIIYYTLPGFQLVSFL